MHPKIYQNYLTDRSKAAMRAKAEQGIFPGCAPLGYKNVKVDGQKTITLDLETAPKVKRLFELASKKKMSLRKLAIEAEKMGLRSRNGKTFGPSSLKGILENPFYIGALRYSDHLSQGAHRAIVNAELFARVQVRLHNKTDQSQ